MSGFIGGGAALTTSLDWKASTRVLAAANVDIANAPANVDGVAMAGGNRILLGAAQVTASQRGLWTYPAGGAGNALVRAEDFDTDAEVSNGATVIVEEGTSAGEQWTLTGPADPITVDVTAQTWTQTGGAGVYTDAMAIAAVENEATLDLDGGRVGIGGVADGAEKLKVTGNIVVTGTVDGVDIATRDHARYADAEAIAAVEGEATLALSGAVSMAGKVVFRRVVKANADTPYTVAATDYIIGCDTSGGVLELDLPAAETGRVLVVKCEGGASGASPITIDPNGTEQIDSAGAGTPLVIGVNYQSYTLYAVTGVGWFII